MSVTTILIVDDEANIRFILERALQHEGYHLETAEHGAAALAKLRQTAYDLVLLDLQMEPIDGLAVLDFIHQQDPTIVVIILTAHSSVESAVEALRMGAFDYLIKPTTPHTIRQRVQAGLEHRQQVVRERALLSQIDTLREMLNTMSSAAAVPVLSPTDVPAAAPTERFVQSGSLLIDKHHRTATLNEQVLDLTTTEFDLLLCLVRAAPKPMSPRQLVNCALGYDSEDSEAKDIIKWHIHHLRRKLTDPDAIKTVRHKGYLWQAQG